jgi:hypothetical protein
MLRAMFIALRRSGLSILCMSLLTVACSRTQLSEEPSHVGSARRSGPAPSAQATDELYAIDEALRDALSGTWTYVGTGPWPGNSRMRACAFHNGRVLIVNAYCSLKEVSAFRVDVYSPTRGRLRIYAEAKQPISGLTLPQYFTFTAESEPPPRSDANFPALALTMSFDQLRAYEERRYRAFLPACFAGHELSRQRGGCLGSLAPWAAAWTERNRAFLEHASDDWYRLVHEMRALSSRYGQEPA